jgi:adenylate cyclase
MRARRAYRIGLIASAVLAVTAGLLAYGLDLLKPADLSSVDTRFDVRGEREAPDDIVFVEIDDSTFNRLRSQFPLPRIHYADAIDNLAADGAQAIAVDVQFTEPGPDPGQDNALILAARRAGDVVLATTEVDAGGGTRIFGGDTGLAFSRGVPAHADFPNDSGGVIRRLDAETDGLQTFPLVTAEVVEGEELTTPDGDSAWIDFAGPPGAIESVPFWRVALGEFPPGTFSDKIVVVGASATSLQDIHPTSTTDEELMPGPEIQANAIATVLEGFPLKEVPGWVNVLLIIGLGALAPLLALRMSALRAILVTIGALVAFAVAAQLLFNGGRIATVVYPALSAAISGTGVLVLFGLLTAFERERTRDAFSRFVPESVVGQVLDQADGIRLGGVSTEGTVMFSDLRGFTSFAEERSPSEVIEILNHYLTAMSDAILDHGGTVVSYMGDGIMAVFGAPIEQPDHADRAVEAARAMVEEQEEFNGWLKELYGVDGFKVGIGLNTGHLMVGNVGSERRLEYTAIGDTANTASRLEGMTKGTPYQIYIADSTRSMLTRSHEGLEEAGEHAVRGRQAKISVWSLADTHHEGPATAKKPAPERAVKRKAAAKRKAKAKPRKT